MKNKPKQSALTLIEVLVTLAVIAILITITVGVSSRINTKAKEQLTAETIELLVTAIEKYYDFWNDFPLIDTANTNDAVELDFDETGFEDSMQRGDTSITITDFPNNVINEQKYVSSEAMYYFLNRTPDCRKILEKINSSLITANGSNNQPMTMKVDNNGNTRDYDLFQINDPWKQPLRYTYNDANDTFPLIQSAGPDKDIYTEDDNIKSR